MIKIDNSGASRVSVVIAAYNEEKSIATTINDILNQDFSEPIELLVCDNNSKDRTVQIATKLGARVVNETQKGTRFAYHRAFQEAQGEIIVMLNADVRVDRNYLKTVVNHYQDPDVVGVGTHVKFYNAPPYINWIWSIIHRIGVLASKLGYNDGITTFWGASLSSTKDVFNKVGGFNHGSNTNEDMIYTRLINEHGKTIYTYDTIARLDGRRYAGNPLKALMKWINGVGCNSIFIGLGMGSKITNFEDIRED